MSNTYKLDIPTQLFFGPGMLDEIGRLSAGLGANALVIMDPYLKDSAVASRVLSHLKAENVDVVEWYDVVANPRAQSIDNAANLAHEQGCDHVVAIGGGSAIDSAKAVCIVTRNEGSCWDYTIREGSEVPEITQPVLPLLVVPTTAGTGTEVTPYAVISKPDEALKATVANRSIFPTISIVDPSLHTSKPRALTASTGLDAFAHAFEAYISIHANAWTDTLALQSIRLFAGSIEECCNNGENVEARAKMAESCYLAGIALGHIGVALPHVLGQALGALKDAPHGAAVAAATVAVIRWTLPIASEKLAVVAEILDPSIAGRETEEKAAMLPSILEGFYTRIGATDTFGSFGLAEDEIEKLTDVAFQSYGRDVVCHPKVASREDVMEIARKCL